MKLKAREIYVSNEKLKTLSTDYLALEVTVMQIYQTNLQNLYLMLWCPSLHTGYIWPKKKEKNFHYSCVMI